MGREVRISIDDDEVFERMKRRKQELDLSWEEVLHRGLRPSPDGVPSQEFEPPWSDGSHDYGQGHGPDHGHRHDGPHGPAGPGHGGEEAIGDVVDEFRRQVKDQVTNSLRASMHSMQEANEELEREMGELAEAEDATLTFDVLDGEEYAVPLRVNQRTSRNGLEVEVVAVRQGKSVRHMNRFDRGARQRVNQSLASGEPATLRFEAGPNSETYRAYPVLSWSKDGEGRPTVSGVEIEEVLLDGE